MHIIDCNGICSHVNKGAIFTLISGLVWKIFKERTGEISIDYDLISLQMGISGADNL